MSREMDERSAAAVPVGTPKDRDEATREVAQQTGTMDEAPTGEAAQAQQEQQRAALFDAGAARDFRERWDDVQIGFVDDPQRAVRKADELVTQVLNSLSDSFAHQRARIEADVGGADQKSTENLRVALRRYRSFFDRLLAL
jgi:hypothetical protein